MSSDANDSPAPMIAQGSRPYFSSIDSLVAPASAYYLLADKEQAAQVEMFNLANYQAFFMQNKVVLIIVKLGEYQRLHLSGDDPVDMKFAPYQKVDLVCGIASGPVSCRRCCRGP
jgi:hypothetical protein